MNPIVDGFLVAVESVPDRTAVATHDRRMSYAELLHQVTPLATRLCERPAGEVVVAAVRDAVDVAVVGLAAMAAARPLSVLSARRDPETILLHTRSVGGTTLVTPSSVLIDDPIVDHAVLPVHAGAGDGSPLVVRPLGLDDAAIIATTSGTTGDPKTIARPVRVVSRSALPEGDILTTRPEDVIFRAFFAAGGGARGILGALSIGASLRCVDPLAVPLSRIVAILEAEQVTFARMVPSVLRRAFSGVTADGRLPHLRALVSGGESLRWEDVVTVRRHMVPGSNIVHTYGSTEVSGIARRIIPFEEPVGEGVVPAGRPRTGRHVWISDEAGAPVEVGVTGRVVIEGYLGAGQTLFEVLPDGTQRFVSGDRGHMDQGGELHLEGRSDDVVKIGAVRVDMAAVEEVIRAAPGVKEAVVVALPSSGRVVLVAHVRLDDRSGEIADEARVRALRAHLSSRLESAAVPARFVIHSRGLPLLPSGKVDRRSLARVDDGSGSTRHAPPTPRE